MAAGFKESLEDKGLELMAEVEECGQADKMAEVTPQKMSGQDFSTGTCHDPCWTLHPIATSVNTPLLPLCFVSLAL